MTDLGPHSIYILFGYGGVALAVAGLLAHSAIAARRVRARLRGLEAQGVVRRSSGTAP